MTLETFVFIVASFSLVYLFLLYRASRNHPDVGGPRFWAVAVALEYLTVLIAGRPEVPGHVATALAMFMGTLGIGFNWLGVCAYLRQPVRFSIPLVIAAISTLITVALNSVDAPIQVGLTVFYMDVAIIACLAFFTQKTARAKGEIVDLSILNGLIGIEATACFISLVWIWLFLPPVPSNDFREHWFYVLLLIYSLDTLTRSSIYFLMVGKILQRYRDQAQESVLERQHRFTDLMENLSSGVLVFSADQTLIDANKAGIELLHFAGGDPRSWSCVDQNEQPLEGEDSPLSMQDDLPPVFHDRVLGVHSTGAKHLRWIMANAYVHQSEKVAHTVSVLTFVDITAHKTAHDRQLVLEAELARSQRMRSLGQLTSGIAHDFNNSLTGISGWITLARDDLPPEHPSLEALDQALKGTRYAQALVRQLQAFSRQEKPKLQWINLLEAVQQSCEFVSAGLIQHTRVQVTSSLKDDSVQADPTQLQQVLVNLLVNASHAMNGEGTVSIELSDFEKLPGSGFSHDLAGSSDLVPGTYRHIRICDTGTGIAPEHLEHLFEPFFTTKKKGRGTGLGLSVAHGVMASHRGGIGVTSVPGEGACFSLFLPVSVPRKDVSSNFGVPDEAGN